MQGFLETDHICLVGILVADTQPELWVDFTADISKCSRLQRILEDRGDGVQSRAFGQFIAERRGPLASQLLCQDHEGSSTSWQGHRDTV